MSIFTNRRNIRVNRANLMRLISRGIIDRRTVSKSGTHITFPSVPFAYAKRINSTCDLEVYNNDEWNFVRNMDYDRLENFYKDEIKKEKLKKDGIIIVHDEIKLDPKIEIQQVEEVPVENITEEVKDEAINDISEESASEVQESIQIGENKEEQEEVCSITTERIDNIENNIDIVIDQNQESSLESVPEEPIMETSEEIENVTEENNEDIIDNTEKVQIETQNHNNYRDLNNYNLNKPTFKKRKRK